MACFVPKSSSASLHSHVSLLLGRREPFTEPSKFPVSEMTLQQRGAIGVSDAHTQADGAGPQAGPSAPH